MPPPAPLPVWPRLAGAHSHHILRNGARRVVLDDAAPHAQCVGRRYRVHADAARALRCITALPLARGGRACASRYCFRQQLR
eukprot:1552406-Pleurochrysis_carterae.AAC.1